MKNGKQPTEPKRRRLEGDDLFTWAKLLAAVEQAIAQARAFAMAVGPQRYGMDAQTEAIDDDGYIVNMRGVQAQQQSQLTAPARRGGMPVTPVTSESPLAGSPAPGRGSVASDASGRA